MIPADSARSLLGYWARWFAPIGEGSVKRTDLNIFYQLGKSFGQCNKVQAGMSRRELALELIFPRTWLEYFLEQTKEISLPETKKAAQRLYSIVNGWLQDALKDWNKQLTLEETQSFLAAQSSFENNFEEEVKRVAVFAVLPKGIYDVEALISRPEEKFSANIQAVLPPQMLYDLKQAALCLAFEIPTACAFHICRGTEALMLEYYTVLTKKPWSFKKKDWNIYIEQLRKEQAPDRITTRLNEIREMDRNAYIHPDVNVAIDEAPFLFELCTGVIFYMAREIERLKT